MTTSRTTAMTKMTIHFDADPGAQRIPWEAEGAISAQLGGVGRRHGHVSLDHHPFAVTRHDEKGVFVIHDANHLVTAESSAGNTAHGGQNPQPAGRNHHRAVVVPFDKVLNYRQVLSGSDGGDYCLGIDMYPENGELRVMILKGVPDRESDWWRMFIGYTPKTHPDPTKNHGKIISSPSVLDRDRTRATAEKSHRRDAVHHWRLPAAPGVRGEGDCASGGCSCTP